MQATYSPGGGMPANIRQANAPSGPEEWYKELPIITRCYLTAAFMSTILAHFGLLNVMLIVWDLAAVKRFQFWRIFTPFVFFGNLGIPFIMQLIILVQYSSKYERNPYNTGAGGGPADYVFMMLFGIFAILIANLYLQHYVLSTPLVYMIMYVWSCREPDSPVSFFGFKFTAMYLPYAMCAFQFLMAGQSAIIMPGLGIAVGHLFYFLIETVPMEYGKDLLRTPDFLINLMGFAGTPGIQVTRPAGGRPAAAAGAMGGHNWGGSGRVLGNTHSD